MSAPRVMVVEDEAITAMGLEASLSKMGYDVVANVPTGEEAVTLARQKQVDVVLMDIQLRGLLDGVAAAEKIRAEVDVPCIYLTAYSDEATLRRAKIAEPYGYIVKPYNERELRAAVEIALHNAAMEQDRRAAREAVEARDRMLQEVLDNTPAVVYLKDADARFTFVNHAFEALTGRSRQDVRGKHGDEVLAPELSKALDADDEKVVFHGVSTSQTALELPHGREMHSYLAARFPLRRPDGSISGMCAFLTDVTRLRRAEDELRKAEERYRMIASSTSDLLTITTLDGTVQYVSPACTRLLGFRPEEIEGQAGYQFIHPDDLARIRATPPPEPGAPRGPITFRLMTKAGDLVWVEAVVQDLDPAAASGERLILSVTRDVSERVRAEEAVRSLNAELEARVAERTRELEAVNRRLQEFNQVVGHDLRAPLRAIRVYAEDLREAVPDAERSHLVEGIARESQRLSDTLNELMTYSRTAVSEISRIDVDLTALATDVVREIRGREPGREVEVDIEQGLACRGDPLLLRLVLQNLVGNAWKFTAGRERARIRVGSHGTSGGKRVFFVEDNGVGFDPKLASRLFQPFQRLHGASFAGTGLGLSSVRSIVERHGGRVWAEGRPGEGATFWFTL